MKKLANLKGVKALNRQQQKEIFGGDLLELGGGGGGWYCGCNSGDNQPAHNPNWYCSAATCEPACASQDGWNGTCISAG